MKKVTVFLLEGSMALGACMAILWSTAVLAQTPPPPPPPACVGLTCSKPSDCGSKCFCNNPSNTFGSCVANSGGGGG